MSKQRRVNRRVNRDEICKQELENREKSEQKRNGRCSKQDVLIRKKSKQKKKPEKKYINRRDK